MPTVDDLVISVRIDPTSELANLQKQLTKLVGKDGTKDVEIELPVSLKTDIDFIRGRITTITQNIFGRSEKEVILNAVTTLRKITTAGGFDDLRKDLGATDTEINTVKTLLEQFGAGIIPNIDRANKILRLINFLIQGEAIEGNKDRLTTLHAIIKMADEIKFIRDNLKKLADKLGLETVKELPIFRLGVKLIDELAPEIGKIFGDFIKANSDSLIKGLFGGPNIMEDLAKAFDLLGVSLTERQFKGEAGIKEILKSPGLSAILAEMLSRIQEKKLIGIPGGFKEAISEHLLKGMTGLTNQYLARIDLVVLKMTDKFKELIPEADLKDIRDTLVALPLKNMVTQSSLREILTRKELFGAGGTIAVALSKVTGIETQFKELNVAISDLPSTFTKHGIFKEMSKNLEKNLADTNLLIDNTDEIRDKLIRLGEKIDEFKPIVDFLKTGKIPLPTDEKKRPMTKAEFDKLPTIGGPKSTGEKATPENIREKLFRLLEKETGEITKELKRSIFKEIRSEISYQSIPQLERLAQILGLEVTKSSMTLLKDIQENIVGIRELIGKGKDQNDAPGVI